MELSLFQNSNPFVIVKPKDQNKEQTEDSNLNIIKHVITKHIFLINNN